MIKLRSRSAYPALALIYAVPAVAQADAQGATRNVAGWIVAASKDGQGCFLTREYDRDGKTTLLLGLEVDGTNHLTVLNANWSIEPKDRLELTFRLSNRSFPEHFAVGIATGGKQGFVTDLGKTCPADFAASRSLYILKGAVPVERLSLEGSGAGVKELRACVDRQKTELSGADGKKAGSNFIPKDPFAPPAEQKRN